MIITCSNDESLKMWSADLEPIQTMLGHTAFVFTVKSSRLGFYASGGEDKTLKIWQEDRCVQDIQQPCSIWSVVFDENSDILVAGSDGFIRSFTTSASRRAEPDIQEMFNKQILESSSKKSGMSEEDIKKLMTTHQMSIFQIMQMLLRAKKKERFGSLETEWYQKHTCGRTINGTKLGM